MPSSRFEMFRENRGRKHLNLKERGAIIALTSQNVSIKKIYQQLGIGESLSFYGKNVTGKQETLTAKMVPEDYQ